jgi:hypothetical protein
VTYRTSSPNEGETPTLSVVKDDSLVEDPASALAACVTTFQSWLYMPDSGPLQVVLATIAANLGDGDPVWLMLVAPPSNGKTEIIGRLSDIEYVHEVSTLTEASLLSGTPNKDRAKDAKGGLLRQIGDFGVIVMKDFTSILALHKDTRATVLAALREIYDGKWTRIIGTDGGKTLHWAGKVGVIAGVTPTIDSHHSVIGSMGERFVMYRMSTEGAKQQALVRLTKGRNDREMRTEMAEALRRVADSIDHDVLNQVPSEVTAKRLMNLAYLTTRCRSAVERDNYSRDITLIPKPEGPARLAMVLLRLLNAFRAIGVAEIDAWREIEKIALDSMPEIRRQVLEHLIDKKAAMPTASVALALGYPTQTARRAMEDLAAHGVLLRNKDGGRDDLWLFEPEFRALWPRPALTEDVFANVMPSGEGLWDYKETDQ